MHNAESDSDSAVRRQVATDATILCRQAVESAHTTLSRVAVHPQLVVLVSDGDQEPEADDPAESTYTPTMRLI